MLLRLLGSTPLLLLPYLSLAQAPINLPSETFKQQLRNKYLHNDTAQAILNLYSKRQAGGASWMVGAALTAARLAASGGSTTTVNGVVVDQQSTNYGAILLATAPFLGYGLGKMLHYSNAHLEQQLTAYAAGQPLPRSVRRKLKPRFFDQVIINYKPIPVKPAP